MKVAMVCIGIGFHTGPTYGPLFQDGSFEFIPRPDPLGIETRTYGNTMGRKGRKLIDYFPTSAHSEMRNRSILATPEFETFTYGDPSRPKARLRSLEEGDMLLFYCGLRGWDFESELALYLIGYFEVLVAGRMSDFDAADLRDRFSNSFYVRHRRMFEQQQDHTILVKGSAESRLLERAVLMSTVALNLVGKPHKILSPEMQEIFGTFDGRINFEHSLARWVAAPYVQTPVAFVRSLV